MRFLCLLPLAVLLAQQPETMSLIKEPLYPPPLARAERARLEDEIAQARGDVARDPSNAAAVLRLARAERELGHVGDALETLTRAIEGKADAPSLHLERGRGFVIIRKFDLAEKEFRKAVDTLPEAHCDLAFSLYLLADYKQSHVEYAACKDAGVFGYLAARRAGVDAGARPAVPDEPVSRRTTVTFPGAAPSKSSTADSSIYVVYMNAVDRLIAGDKQGAVGLLKPVIEKQQDRWMEPIYIAAEADYARIYKPPRKKKKK